MQLMVMMLVGGIAFAMGFATGRTTASASLPACGGNQPCHVIPAGGTTACVYTDRRHPKFLKLCP